MFYSHPRGGTAPIPPNDPPDEETGQFGDSSDPGLESDEDLDGEHDSDGGPPLHRRGA
jgi:hypothetical protein